jgi:L-ribulose-5-phosphate 3-epimerase
MFGSNVMKRLTRRDFGRTVAAATILSASGHGVRAVPALPEACVFSKHLQWLSYEEMGEFAARLGFAGVDLTVRPGGHVLPENVERDLPKAVKAVEAAGLRVPLIATAVTTASDDSRRLLATAADLGVRFYRLGYYRYTGAVELDDTLDRARRDLEGLALLNEELGIRGDYQNHAGEGYLGAAVWDLWYVLRNTPESWLGCQFDLRHAVVEGGRSWPVDLRRIRPRIHTLAVKNFRWNPDGTVRDCPLDEGVADFPRFFGLLGDFSGPMSLHLEYPLGGADQGARELSVSPQVVASAMERDLAALTRWLQSDRL